MRQVPGWRWRPWEASGGRAAHPTQASAPGRGPCPSGSPAAGVSRSIAGSAQPLLGHSARVWSLEAPQPGSLSCGPQSRGRRRKWVGPWPFRWPHADQPPSRVPPRGTRWDWMEMKCQAVSVAHQAHGDPGREAPGPFRVLFSRGLRATGCPEESIWLPWGAGGGLPATLQPRMVPHTNQEGGAVSWPSPPCVGASLLACWRPSCLLPPGHPPWATPAVGLCPLLMAVRPPGGAAAVVSAWRLGSRPACKTSKSEGGLRQPGLSPMSLAPWDNL